MRTWSVPWTSFVQVVQLACDDRGDPVSSLVLAKLLDELGSISSFLLTCRVSCSQVAEASSSSGVTSLDKFSYCPFPAIHLSLRESEAVFALIPDSPIIVDVHSNTSNAQVHI